MTPRLETPRLVLRPFAPSDWAVAKRMLSNSETTRYMHFASWTEEQRRRWFDSCVSNGQVTDANAINWAIARKDTEQMIGWFGIGTSPETSFGYLLDRAFWNQGYMTEALGAVLTYEFEVHGASQVHATCGVANPASARVMEKCGMRHEKTVYDADFEGNWAHRHHYAIIRAEYKAGKTARS